MEFAPASASSVSPTPKPLRVVGLANDSPDEIVTHMAIFTSPFFWLLGKGKEKNVVEMSTMRAATLVLGQSFAFLLIFFRCVVVVLLMKPVTRCAFLLGCFPTAVFSSATLVIDALTISEHGVNGKPEFLSPLYIASLCITVFSGLDWFLRAFSCTRPCSPAVRLALIADRFRCKSVFAKRHFIPARYIFFNAVFFFGMMVASVIARFYGLMLLPLIVDISYVMSGVAFYFINL